MGRPAIGKRAMTGAERQRRHRDKLKDDPEAKAARIADEILDFLGIELTMDVLEGCLAGYEGEDEDEGDDEADRSPYYDFEVCGQGDERPRLYRLLTELDQLVDWEPEYPDASALAEFLGERDAIRLEREQAEAQATRNRRTQMLRL